MKLTEGKKQYQLVGKLVVANPYEKPIDHTEIPIKNQN